MISNKTSFEEFTQTRVSMHISISDLKNYIRMKISINMVNQQICIFAHLMSLQNCGFYFVIKRHWSVLDTKSKMAANSNNENNERMIGNKRHGESPNIKASNAGHARRRREEGLGSSSPSVPAGRVGIVPWDLTGRES